MREKRTVQSSIFEHYPDHEIGRDLQAMSQTLEAHPDWLDWVEADVGNRNVEQTGRKGLPFESVLRCAVLKQYRRLSYSELAFCLMDSNACQAFARLPMGAGFPKKTMLQSTISAITSGTWERINQQLLLHAQAQGVEKGRMVRVDSTVCDSPIHAPSDSTLLWDGVRTLVRLLGQAQTLAPAVKLPWHDHRRVAKKRMRAIAYTRGMDKKAKLYADLIEITRKTLGYVEQADRALSGAGVATLALWGWRGEVAHYRALIERVIDQTERRVFQGESVPAEEKIVSLFEEHTDIIVKGARQVQYGHKLNLSTGKSGLVLDVVIEAGNPSDTDRLIPMLDRHKALYGKAPRQMAADGGYASKENRTEAKERGVKDVVLHKKRGLKVEAMAKSPWVYRKLRNFRAGIEAGISWLKRAYGLGRCTWKGLAHFKAYVWSAVVAHNLALLGRLSAA